MKRLRLVVPLLVAFCVVSCHTPGGKPGKKKPKQGEQDVSSDVAFQAFLGRLRKAVAARDVHTIASMMTPTFGYRLEPIGEGEGVFQFWEENQLWDDLDGILRERFVPKGAFMVAPPQFGSDGSYTGHRAGIVMINGSWKFAYFVSG